MFRFDRWRDPEEHRKELEKRAEEIQDHAEYMHYLHACEYHTIAYHSEEMCLLYSRILMTIGIALLSYLTAMYIESSPAFSLAAYMVATGSAAIMLWSLVCLIKKCHSDCSHSPDDFEESNRSLRIEASFKLFASVICPLIVLIAFLAGAQAIFHFSIHNCAGLTAFGLLAIGMLYRFLYDNGAVGRLQRKVQGHVD